MPRHPGEQAPPAAKQANETIETTQVRIRVGPNGRKPVYATIGSAGCDLIAAEEMCLQPGETRLMPLDWVMALEPGVEAQVRPRSGLSLKTSLRIPNSPGTIDSDFRSPVCVLIENTFSQADLPMKILSDPKLAALLAQPGRQVTLADYLASQKASDSLQSLLDHLPELAGQILYLDDQGLPFGTIRIKKGERIAQMVFSRTVRAVFEDHAAPEAIGHDRGGGFGSTGV